MILLSNKYNVVYKLFLTLLYMKNSIKFIVVISCMFVLFWCFWKDESSNTTTENTQQKTNPNKLENKEYEKIADKKEWLKNATSEDLDKIIQEEIKILNTPSTNYPFFEQLSQKKWNIDEIKKAWWMEVTRWQVYLVWLEESYTFVNELLSDNEKKYAFHQKDNGFNFFFLDAASSDDFIKKLKAKVTEYKEIFNDNWSLNLEFKFNNVKYSMQVHSPTWMARDDLDNILSKTTNPKVSINVLN